MPRRMVLWRIEFGAGIAAAIIGALTLAMALLAPLYPTCSVAITSASACPANTTRYVSLLSAHPEGRVWALLLGLLALTLVGAAGAIGDARSQPTAGARLGVGAGILALWGAALAVFVICALGSRGPLGLLYLPSTLTLALGAYVALLRRIAERRAIAGATDTPPPAG